MKKLTRLIPMVAIAMLLAAGLATAATLMGTENYSGAYVNIWEVTVDGGVCTSVLLDSRAETPAGLNFNGNALDPVTCRFYYVDYKDDATINNRFFFYHLPSGITTQTPSPGLEGPSAGGSMFNGDYYYVRNGTNQLWKVTFDGSGLPVSEDKVCDIPLGGDRLRFGDIAFDPGTPIIYGSAIRWSGSSDQGARFFRLDSSKVDASSNCYDYTEWSSSLGLQIAFGMSDGILYGHNASTGDFYTIDHEAVTPTWTWLCTPNPTVKLADLASGECEQLVFEGCTPGYWKQKHHFDSWIGYAPTDNFETVFSVDASFEATLGEALKLRGGGEKALARHAVAALLSASNPDVNYPYSESMVIQIVQDAYATGNFEGAKDDFEAQNEQICPLN